MSFLETEVITGYGKHLAYSDTDAGSYTNIYGTVEIDLPERELGTTEITNDDTPDATKDYIPDLFEPGTAKFSYLYGKTQFTAIETLYQSRAVKFWKLTYRDGSTAKWRGFITKHDLPAELEGALEVSGEMQVKGKVTYAAGTGA